MNKMTHTEPIGQAQNKLYQKILVVDDDDGILDALGAMLDNAGYEVATSSDGEVLSQINKDNMPRLVLLDVLLSGQDGRELCKLMKSKESTKKIPILMISADPTVEEGIKRSGADGFIAKPFEMQELLTAIAKYIGAEQ